MRRLIVPLVVIMLLAGAEAAARNLEERVPEPLVWDTQFSQDKAEQIAGLGERLDVVFMGSSVAQANLDPEVFVDQFPEFSVGYNAGLPALTPRVWRQFLLDTVYREHCPGLLVIGVDIRQFSDNKPGSEGQLWRYSQSPGRLDAIGETDFWREAEEWLESNFALFRTRARLREPDKVLAWVWKIGEKGDWRNTNLSPFGRYQSNDDRTYEASEERLEGLRNVAFQDLAFGGTETNALRTMIEEAQDRGVSVVLVEMPAMNDQLARALPNGADDLEWFTEVLTEVAAEYGIRLVRVPEMDNEPMYYSDDYHMNWTGIEHITLLVADRIAALNLAVGPGICPIGE